MVQVPDAAILTASVPALNEKWAGLLHLAKREEHPRGSSIYPYGDSEHSFYFLESGRLTILHGSVSGRVQNMLYMQPGTLINVAQALGHAMTDFLDTGCQFFCLSDVVLWKFPGSLLHDPDFIRQHPEHVENVMASVGLKLLLMHNTLANAGTGSALSRVCRFCLNMSQANGNALELVPNISQGKLANLLGMHRISLLRSLQTLKEEGVLEELTSERLAIRDLERLKELAML